MQEEKENRKKLLSLYIKAVAMVVIFLAIILSAAFSLEEGPLLGTIVAISTMLLVVAMFHYSREEVEIGYYECKHCHNRYKPESTNKAIFAPNMGTTRYLKCPKCNKRSWTKKVMSKD